MDKTGAFTIRSADVTGPGLALKASGTGRFPANDKDPLTADGAVTAKANLLDLSQVLRPFGVLSDDVKIAGAADFDGKVATGTDGISGSGTLDLAGLNLQLAADQPPIQEQKLHVPLTFAAKPREKRWEVAVANMTSTLVAGTIRGTYIEGVSTSTATSPASATVVCGISFDAGRLSAILKKWLPADLQVAGGWTLRASAAGPLRSGGTWNEQIADFASEGILTVGRAQYLKFIAGNGSVHWKQADGQIDLNPVPTDPSRLTVVGGTLNLAGIVELRGPVPRLVISKPLKLIDGVPLSDPGLHDYVKYVSPVFGWSVKQGGKASVDVASLTLPLSAEEYKKMTGSASFTIDKFQTPLSAALTAITQLMPGKPKEAPVQQFGPIKASVADGKVVIEPHTLDLGGGAVLEFKGKIGLDETMDVEIQFALTQTMLAHFGVASQVAPYLLNQKISVPLTGTIDKPQLDDKVIAKRIGEMAVEAAKKFLDKKLLDSLPDILKGIKMP
jgi:hypothetical protein